MSKEVDHRLRFYKLANGLMSIAYISLFAYFLAELSNLIF